LEDTRNAIKEGFRKTAEVIPFSKAASVKKRPSEIVTLKALSPDIVSGEEKYF
jgi:hypothetical protein